jgi:arylsulfatase A-like enzyme
MNARRNKALLLLIVSGPPAVLALGIAIMGGRPPGPPPPIAAGALQRANVLLVTIDALRADHVGVYGSAGTMTPAIDRFAKEGLHFARTYAHVPVSLPSHRTLMTGMYPHRHDAAATLAGALQSAGYETAAFVGSRDLAEQPALASGFDHYDDAADRVRNAEEVFTAAYQWVSLRAQADPANAGAPRSPADSRQPASAGGTRPWFAWIQLADPNAPYVPPEPFRSKYKAEGYDGEIAYVDAAFMGFVTSLRRHGPLDDTLVVLMAAYGESLGEHGERTHGALAYDATLRVPLILWGRPRVRPGTVSELMRVVDVAPTVLDLVGAGALAGTDGRSVRPFIGGGQPFDDRESYFAVNGLRGVVSGWWKLIESRPPELYDLQADPGELQNLYQAGDPAVLELRAILDRVAAN